MRYGVPQRGSPGVERIAATEASAAFDRLLDIVSEEGTRFSVERGGCPVAVLLSTDDYRRLTQLEQEREERFGALDHSWQAFADLQDDDTTVEQQVAEAVSAAREKRRKGQRADYTA